ncbi:hypothetical protein CPter291_2440 [Collimonas pratensis]|uniref:Uncharacterized protein n=1 Tax=Collimonas pratensis TaxID=279113 RepID=A0ABM5Z6M2_9BURK|nr:hypothetical protein CPter291_2440 [Collimonas pratensis]
MEGKEIPTSSSGYDDISPVNELLFSRLSSMAGLAVPSSSLFPYAKKHHAGRFWISLVCKKHT